MAKFDFSKLKNFSFGSKKPEGEEEAKGKGASKKNIIIAVIVLLLFSAGGIGFFFYMAGGTGKEQQKVTDAFIRFSSARANGKPNEIAGLISMSFNDAGMPYNVAVVHFSQKADGYSTILLNVNVLKDEAKLSYKRMETMNKKLVSTMVVGEVWKKENGKWLLSSLSEVDRKRIIAEGPNKGSAKAKADRKATTGDKVKAEIESLAKEKAEAEAKKENAEGKPEDKAAPVAEAGSAIVGSKEDWKKEEEEVLKAIKETSFAKLAPYRSKGKRDPFRSLIIGFGPGSSIGPSGKFRCDAKRSKGYLESFDLLSLKLVGIIGGDSRVALIQTPNGNGYTVKKGMYIGRRCGRIKQIGDSKLVVLEKYFHARKGFEIKKTEVTLKAEEKQK